jgi:dipeptidase D
VPNPIDGLKPALVWNYFAEISRIPRGSKNEAAVARYVLETAKSLGLASLQDRAGNVVVRKPATAGRERTPSVCLQGHLDMVCEKNADTKHDFMNDPIELVRSGNMMTANGTTLGADNGIAVATNLAIMADTSIEHGPLEFLFTTDEETGLTGAANLSADFLKSRILLNLDSEEEGSLYVGCSGGRDTTGKFPVTWEHSPAGSAAYLLTVNGLRGGHSGLEIDKNRGNAIKILNRVLIPLAECGARVARIDGGNKRNAIPRECVALLFIPKKSAQEALAIVGKYSSVIRAETGKGEPDLAITLSEQPKAKRGKVVSRSLQKKFSLTIAGLPHGVLKMHSDLPGLVETSTNVAVITTSKKAIAIDTSQRSSVASELDEAVQSVLAIFTMAGAAAESGSGYPGWKPNLDSAILAIARRTYKTLFNNEPEIKAIHAGLECGIIGERVPGMDMVSLGPTLEGVHSPDERIHIDTVERFWNFVLAILRNVN